MYIFRRSFSVPEIRIFDLCRISYFRSKISSLFRFFFLFYDISVTYLLLFHSFSADTDRLIEKYKDDNANDANEYQIVNDNILTPINLTITWLSLILLLALISILR